MSQSLSSPAGPGVSHALEQCPSWRPRSLRHAVAAVLAALASAHPLPALAAYTCTGKVKQLTTDPAGNVNLSLAGDGVVLSWQTLCSVSESSQGISPAACKAILVTLKEAQVSQRAVTFWFDYDSPDPAKCTEAQHPPWSHLRSSGWYWGPMTTGE